MAIAGVRLPRAYAAGEPLVSVVFILDTEAGQLRVEDPICVRIDREGKGEFYVMVIDDSCEEHAISLHETSNDARSAAAALAKRLHCEWGHR